MLCNSINAFVLYPMLLKGFAFYMCLYYIYVECARTTC